MSEFPLSQRSRSFTISSSNSFLFHAHPLLARSPSMPLFVPAIARARALVAVFALPVLALVLSQIAPAAETAPAPRAPGEARAKFNASELDQALMDEVKSKSELMKNLEYLSDSIGGRLTGSKNVE